jgi:hypothetical protein
MRQNTRAVRSAARQLLELRGAVEGKQADAVARCCANGAFTFDGVSERQAMRRDASTAAECDLARTRQIETSAELCQGRDNLGGRIRLDGIIDLCARQHLVQGLVTSSHNVKIKDEKWRWRTLLGRN